MNLTNPVAMFDLASLMVMPGWIWLIIWLFLPQPWQRRTGLVGLILPLLLGVLYASAIAVHMSSSSGGFDSLAGVLSLFNQPGTALAGWIHFLSFDLFVGWCITQHAVSNRVNRWLLVPCLLFTFMLGPIGLLLYAAIFTGDCLVSKIVGKTSDKSPLWRQVTGGQSALAQCSVVLFFLIPVLLIALLSDTRTVLETNVWIKPLKFTVALFVYTLTLSWYSNYLSPGWRDSQWFTIFNRVVVSAIVLEMVWLIYAAAIGEPSHFNQTHPILSHVYFIMGILAVVLTANALVIGIGLLTHQSSELNHLTRFSLAYGLVATFILTLITASYMSSSPAQAHAVLPEGLSAISEKHALPLLGWLREAGDLRVAHFFATHAMHFVPLAGLVIARAGMIRRDNTVAAKRTALGLCALYAAGVFFVFLQAIGGRPFL